MLRPLIRLLSSLWRPFGRRGGGVGGGGGDGVAGRAGLLWSRDLGRCAGGEFSMAVVQANRVLEDQSRIESGPFGTFVGVYDGHGGPDAARYVCDHLFAHFREISSGPQGVTCDGIQRAFLATEESFIALVSQLWNTRPDIATTGSCCLVGVVCQQTLYVANLGDSRVILGKKVGSTGEIAAISLSNEHNANVDAVRQELQAQHPNDPQIVILKHGVWRIKGIIQVSRSIGDAYMKHSQYNREPINPKFRIAEPMNMPILTANPSIMFHHLEQSDSFLIFASDGLWEHLSDQKAVEIVHSHPRAQENERCDIQISKGLTRRSAGIFMMILLSSLYSLIMRRFKITCKFLSFQFEVLWIIEAHEEFFQNSKTFSN
ncbi:probable protein phosphatase 2C 42 isoform X1 [Musa acuminata AAA Group]|uniref:protein-serine/threonine phosphatase n=1 Tax=Musa acuminata subsp. malaccensis TaxID=214687 RepID=A0A804HZ16_MUSAM|nr:PREDICTED: probable protein phosphatase 2C 42 isoform X3 [Musa acuminata subsp. malaccensis]